MAVDLVRHETCIPTLIVQRWCRCQSLGRTSITGSSAARSPKSWTILVCTPDCGTTLAVVDGRPVLFATDGQDQRVLKVLNEA